MFWKVRNQERNDWASKRNWYLRFYLIKVNLEVVDGGSILMSKTQEKADVKMNDFEGVNMIMY